MKGIIAIGAVAIALPMIGAFALNKKVAAIYELATVETIILSDDKTVIPVSVTLTKYQLEKMLDILEEDNSYNEPADPQDKFTFTSVARENTQAADGYSISSTHLARKPHKQ